MAKQVIGIGSTGDDSTGDPLRTAMDKTNGNFTEIYNWKASFTSTGNSLTLAADATAVLTLLGLENVANTADPDKPVSTATQDALDDKADLSYVDTELDAIDSALLAKADSSAVASALTGKETAGAAAAAQAYSIQRANHTGTQSWSTLTSTPTTLTGYGITDAQPLDSDLTAIAALTTTTYGRALLALADAAALRSAAGLGSLSTLSAISSTEITDGTIVNADINASAAITLSKLATDPLARANHTGTQAASTITALPVSICVACSDESTALTAGTTKVCFRAPYAFTLTAVRAAVKTAPTGSTLIVDINEAGTTVLSTKLSIDASETTSTTAASVAVISDASIADDAEITIDIDQVGSSVAGAGLKVWLIGTR